MYISSNVLVTLLGVGLTGLIGLITWLVRQTNQHAAYMAAMKESSDDHGERLRNLEAWRNGIDFGRAAERAKPPDE